MLNLSHIRDRATALNLCDSALAQACDVSPETFSRWIAQESVPRPHSLKALASVLQTDLDSLVSREPCADVTWFGATAQLSVMDRERAALRGDEMSRQLHTLRSHLSTLSPPAPSATTSNPALRNLVRQHLHAGHVFIPVRWSSPLQHYAVAVLRHPETPGAFVYVNVTQSVRTIEEVLALKQDTASLAEQQKFIHVGAPEPGALAQRSRESGSLSFADSAPAAFVESAGGFFETPVFEALRTYQCAEGGCDAAFISDVLGIHIFDAYKLAQVLNKK
jgi:transcriptional regulator with XRE-family HTH domain